jgi:hypothetical protein
LPGNGDLGHLEGNAAAMTDDLATLVGTIFLIVSGAAAACGLPASLSATTAIFMLPRARAHADNLTPGTGRLAADNRRRVVLRSGKENRHQDHNDGDHRDGGLRQRHERAIHLFVTRVIVAPCCGVFELTVVVHRSPPGAILLGI